LLKIRKEKEIRRKKREKDENDSRLRKAQRKAIKETIAKATKDKKPRLSNSHEDGKLERREGFRTTQR